MRGRVKALLCQQLRCVADKIEDGTSELSMEDALEIINTICNVSLSKEESSHYLNMPTSTFDKQVRSGKLPESHKQRGLTERLWYFSDLLKARLGL